MNYDSLSLGTIRISNPQHVQRNDIQGLRAIAIILVVFDHLFGFPTGGFVGVDVFFAISGFLITSLMLRELSETGTISFQSFYIRRIRRILPVAFIALVVTVVISFTLWFPPRALQIGLDAFWAFLFVSNWHFQLVGSDYFASGIGRSPFLHYWSLSIEEQFYALWPLIVLFVAIISNNSRRVLGYIIIILLIASLVHAGIITQINPKGAYFDTFARMWELLLGAYIAVVGCAGSRVNILTRKVIQAIGIGLIFGTAVLIASNMSLPIPWVIPAVVGAGLVIWAEAPSGNRSILGNRLFLWFGDVSYSLYIWHFPIIVFCDVLLGNHWWSKLIALVVMLSVAQLSRKYIEKKFLNKKLLVRDIETPNKRGWFTKDIAIGVLVLLLSIMFIGSMKYGPSAIHDAMSIVKYLRLSDYENSINTPVVENQRIQQVREGLILEEWPLSINDPASYLMSLNSRLFNNTSCVNLVDGDGKQNWCGDPKNSKWMLVGDSVAISWFPVLVKEAHRRGQKLAGLGYAGCQMANGLEYSHPIFGVKFPSNCATAQSKMLDEILVASPDVLFLTGHAGVLERINVPILEAEAIWQQHYENLLQKLTHIPTIIILESTPWSRNNSECLNRLSKPFTCISEVDDWHLAKERAEIAASASHKNVVFMHTRDWFCLDNRCPQIIDSYLVMADGLHFSLATAKALQVVTKNKIDLALNRQN